MVTAVTVGWPHKSAKGESKPEIITGPEVGVSDQVSRFKKLTASRYHQKFERVEILASNAGSIRSAKFISAEEVDRQEKAKAKQEADYKAIQEKAKAKPESKK